MRVLLIDNYDSFTYNLAVLIASVLFPKVPSQTSGRFQVPFFSFTHPSYPKRRLAIARNDAFTFRQLRRFAPHRLVLSPGPGTPDQAGLCMKVIDQWAGQIPLLGVCLGHQCIGLFLGGALRRAPQIVHGAPSSIFHRQTGLLRGLPSPFPGARYHSWIIEKRRRSEFTISAWTPPPPGFSSPLIMGLENTALGLYGVQFHPESFMTSYGRSLIRNFLAL